MNSKSLFWSQKRKKSKNLYYSKLIENYKICKKTWNIMKEIIGKTKTKTRNVPRIFDKKTIAKQFNDYLSNIGPNLVSNV